jgi:hypothetical protein
MELPGRGGPLPAAENRAGPGWSGYLLIVQVFSNHPGGPTQAEAARFLHHLLERVWPLLPRR